MDEGAATVASAKECLFLLSETIKHIDSFKLMSTPGNSKLTIYSELTELKNTVDTLKLAIIKYLSQHLRSFPSQLLKATKKALKEITQALLSVDYSSTADVWNATHLRLYQLDFLLAFQCHQLQELCSEHYLSPSSVLCTSTAKEFWETFFPALVRLMVVSASCMPLYAMLT
jgi:hypothetical protein